jgi:hypothetical protein
MRKLLEQLVAIDTLVKRQRWLELDFAD